MSKKILEEIKLLTSSISTLYGKIPKTRVDSIKKDVFNLTSDLNLKSNEELNEIKSLMNAKLKALKRVYASDFLESNSNNNEMNGNKNHIENKSNHINSYKNSINFKSEVINQSGVKIPFKTISLENDILRNNKLIKEEKLDSKLLDSEDEVYEWKSSYEELRKSPFFNKEIVNKYHQEQDDIIQQYKDKVFLEFKTNLKKKVDELRSKGKLKEINDEFNKISLIDSRWASKDINGNYTFNKEKLEKEIVELFNICFGSGGEEYYKNLDLDKIQSIKPISDASNLNNNDESELISDNFMKPTQDELDNINNNKQTEIEYGSNGKIRINKFFKEDEKMDIENDNNYNDNFNEKSKIKENIIQMDSTREKFVWRNGKLVPGEGSKRKLATLINWNSSNLDPNDVKRHRELLDRQHFSGPLWEGIKRTTLLDEPIHIDNEEFQNNSVSKEEYEKNNIANKGKQEIEEIVR